MWGKVCLRVGRRRVDCWVIKIGQTGLAIHRVMEAESKVCCLEDGRMMTELVTWRDYEVSPPWGSPVWDTGSCGVCRSSRWCCPGCRATWGMDGET